MRSQIICDFGTTMAVLLLNSLYQIYRDVDLLKYESKKQRGKFVEEARNSDVILPLHVSNTQC